MGRKEIKQALLNDLGKITQENGYQSTLKKVFKQFKELDDLNETQFPSAALMDLGTKFRNTAEGLTEGSWDISIVVYAKDSSGIANDDNGDLGDKFEELFEDVQELIETGLTGTDYPSVESIEITGIVPDPFNENTRGMAYIPIKIIYY